MQKNFIRSYDDYNIQFLVIYFLIGICLFQVIYHFNVKLFNLLLLVLLINISLILLNYFINSTKILPYLFNGKSILLNICSLFLGLFWINIQAYNFKKNSHLWELTENKPIIIHATVLNVIYRHKNNTNQIVELDLLVNKIINNFALTNLINPKHFININNFLINNKIRLTWKTNKIILPGNIWQLSVRFKKPRNFSTLGNLDLEKQLFMQRIKLIGVVANNNTASNKSINNKLISNTPLSFVHTCWINKIRRILFNKLLIDMQNWKLKHPGIILGFLLSNKENILFNEKTIFQTTGTSHLLCISGLHLGTLASFIFIITQWLWKKLSNRYLLEKFPAVIVASIFSLLITTIYAILAGLNPPTLRALIMLSGYLGGIITRNSLEVDLIYFLSIFLILLLDPFVILNNSFWLSYIAVGILIFTSKFNLLSATENHKKSLLFIKILNLFRNNWIMFVGLLPINMLLFNKIYLIAYLANFIAIPWFNFFILPWSIIGLFISIFNLNLAKYLLIFADFNLYILLNILAKLAKFKNAYLSLGIIDIPMFCLSFLGSLLLILPKGLRNTYISIICFLPVFFKYKSSPKYADAWISILDVGQGLGVVIQLQNNIILYDTGPNNLAIANYLESLNLNHLNQVIISHPDLDHIGGLKQIANKYIIDTFITNINGYKIADLRSKLCQADIGWELDGVKFKFLNAKLLEKNNEFNFNLKSNYKNPKKSHKNPTNNNDNSCILQMSTNGYKVLFTGDISAKTEKLLINKYQQELTADLLIVPHHGSITSSSKEFIKLVNPKYAIISAGYMNRYAHPHTKILNRYKNYNIKILNTIEHGSIDFKLFNQANNFIQYSCYRQTNWNFWNY